LLSSPSSSEEQLGAASAHLSKRDFLFAWHAPNFAQNRPQPELAIPGVSGIDKARRVSSGTVVRRAFSSLVDARALTWFCRFIPAW
jgi:hypothetical protein